MGERITLTASDGFILNAYRAKPAGTPRGGVVVIQEVWGLNHFVRDVVDRYARHGFVAVAPAMFDRVEFGYESDDYSPAQFAVIGELMKKFNHQMALVDVTAAIGAAKAGGELARGASRHGAERGLGLLWRRRAELYRFGADHPHRNAFRRSGHRHSARADRDAQTSAPGGGYPSLPRRAWVL